MIGKIDSVFIWTEDANKLKPFYRDALGLEVTMEDGEFAAFKLPGGETQIVMGKHSEVHGQSKEPDRIMVNFSVDDIQKTYEELRGRGVEFTREPSPEPEAPMIIATFRDPDGNTFQLFQQTGEM